MTQQSAVYLIEARDRFKVGKSVNPNGRVRAMKVAHGHVAGPMFLRFFAYGTTKEEAAIHRAIRPHCISGMGREWFRRCDESWRTAIEMMRALPEFSDLIFRPSPFTPGTEWLARMEAYA